MPTEVGDFSDYLTAAASLMETMNLTIIIVAGAVIGIATMLLRKARSASR